MVHICRQIEDTAECYNEVSLLLRLASNEDAGRWLQSLSCSRRSYVVAITIDDVIQGVAPLSSTRNLIQPCLDVYATMCVRW